MTLLTETNTKVLNTSVLLLRITLGSILFVAGAGKVLGWFDGKGIDVTITNFTQHLGIPAPLAYLSCYTEFLGGALLILGLMTRPAAFAITINMLVATLTVLPHGFFGPGGASYPFSLMITSIVILLMGPMAYSLDALFSSAEPIHELKVLRNGLIGRKSIAH